MKDLRQGLINEREQLDDEAFFSALVRGTSTLFTALKCEQHLKIKETQRNRSQTFDQCVDVHVSEKNEKNELKFFAFL